MDALLDQIKAKAGTVDETGRRAILDKLRDLAFSIEAPEDTMQRILYQNLQIAVIKVGVDLKIFNSLAESPNALDVEQLAKTHHADPLLLTRVLRYLASFGIIKEDAKNTYTANNITRTLAIEGNQSGIYHQFENLGPQYQDLPSVLAEKKYENLSDNTQTVFNKTFKSDLPAFIWFSQQPERWNHFNKYMTAQRVGMPTWLDVYPVKDETSTWDPQKPVLVDVGGGFGHQCAALQAQYPDLKGEIVLQDLPQTLAHAMPLPNVKVMEHDFFKPQPVKGAKYYYLRNILHDWSEDNCVAILSNLKAAMGEGSLILIDDMVLPDIKASWQATQIDLTMMTALGSLERTLEQWQTLLKAAGLKIVKIYQYNVSVHDSVIAVAPTET